MRGREEVTRGQAGSGGDMSAAAAVKADEAGGDAAPAKGGRKKLILMAAPVLLAAVLAGLWFSGILPPLLGMGHAAEHAEGHGEGKGGEGEKRAGKAEDTKGKAPSFIEMPEIVANLNTGARKAVYVKLAVRLELAKAEDEAAVKATMPRLLDMFQTYLREMRPEELRGSAGSYRLREELTGRANVAVAPARILDVLFTEMLIQ